MVLAKKVIDYILTWYYSITVIGCMWVFSQVFLLASFRIPSDSMEPGIGRRGLCGGLETDARRTTVRPQCDTAAGTDRNTPRTGISESQAGRCAGLQLPAPERLGQDRDAHPEILHQTVHRLAGRHAFHPGRKVPDKRRG